MNLELWIRRKNELHYTYDDIAEKAGLGRRTVANIFSERRGIAAGRKSRQGLCVKRSFQGNLSRSNAVRLASYVRNRMPAVCSPRGGRSVARRQSRTADWSHLHPFP